MRIALGTVEIDDDARRLIADHYGYPGLAPRVLCRSFIVRNGTEELDTLAVNDDERRQRRLEEGEAA